MSESRAWAALAELRGRTGLSTREVATAIEMPHSTYSSYERETYKKPFIPVTLAKKLQGVFVGRGEPPITDDEVLRLAGITGIRSTPAPERRPPEHGPAAPVPEVDVLAGAGLGGEALVSAFTDAQGNTVSQDVVRAEWGIPEAYAANVLGLRAKQARIMEIRGDSMAPTLLSGDRVMVDIGDRLPSPDGLFALFDGLGVVVKRLERVPNTDPPTFRIISDNPKHSAYERTLEEIHLIGRVVWLARKI